MTADLVLTPLKEGIAKLRDAECLALAQMPEKLRKQVQSLGLEESKSWKSLAASVPEIHRLWRISELITFAESVLDDLQNEGPPQQQGGKS